jgi:hypothetical protein
MVDANSAENRRSSAAEDVACSKCCVAVIDSN